MDNLSQGECLDKKLQKYKIHKIICMYIKGVLEGPLGAPTVFWSCGYLIVYRLSLFTTATQRRFAGKKGINRPSFLPSVKTQFAKLARCFHSSMLWCWCMHHCVHYGIASQRALIWHCVTTKHCFTLLTRFFQHVGRTFLGILVKWYKLYWVPHFLHHVRGTGR